MIVALWCLFGVLLLLAVVGYSYRGAGPEGADPASDVGGLLMRWMWTATLAVGVIAGYASISHAIVTDDELLAAAERGTARVDGRFDVNADALEIVIGDELGKAVTVSSLDFDHPNDTDARYAFLVTPGDDPVTKPNEAAQSDDAVCVSVTLPRQVSPDVRISSQLARVEADLGNCRD